MTFPWLIPSVRRGGVARSDAQVRELRDRAALFFRLGVPVEQATARLIARVEWEVHPAARASELSDAAIAQLVRDTYARRPSGA